MQEEYISERISQLRNKKSVSARDMSLSLGQSENYINMIENKKTLPSMISFFNICEYFNISPSDFFAEEIENPEKLNTLLREAKKLDDDTIDLLLGIIKKLNK